MVRRIEYFMLVLVATLALAGCSSTPEEMESLDKAARSYERFIRWGEFDKAKQFHLKNPVLDDLERRRLQFYRVTAYNIVSYSTPNLKHAYMIAEIKYYKNDRPVIKTITVKQDWEYDEEKKIWSLTTPFPHFR